MLNCAISKIRGIQTFIFLQLSKGLSEFVLSVSRKMTEMVANESPLVSGQKPPCAFACGDGLASKATWR